MGLFRFGLVLVWALANVTGWKKYSVWQSTVVLAHTERQGQWESGSTAQYTLNLRTICRGRIYAPSVLYPGKDALSLEHTSLVRPTRHSRYRREGEKENHRLPGTQTQWSRRTYVTNNTSLTCFAMPIKCVKPGSKMYNVFNNAHITWFFTS